MTSWLFITVKADQLPSLRALITVWLDIAISAIMSLTDEFHDRVGATWREERDRSLRDMESLHCAEDDLIDDGLALLDFARTAHSRVSGDQKKDL